MGTDEGEPAGQGEPEPALRRSTFVPAAAPTGTPPETPLVKPSDDPSATAPGKDEETHGDDELAGALEHEVSRLTASLPIIRPESLFMPVAPPEPPYEPHSDEEREIAKEADRGDTLAAIEHLEALIAVRRGDTAAIAVVQAAAPTDEAAASRTDQPSDRPAPPPSLPDEPPATDIAESPARVETEPAEDVVGAPAPQEHVGLATSEIPIPGVPELDADVTDDADDLVEPDSLLAPIATPRVRPHEDVLTAGMPEPMPLFAVEQSGSEPTPLEYRVGRASRLFWLWFAAGASVLVIGLGAALVEAGLNLLQVLIAAVLGIALSFIPLGLGSLAGVWSGQPTVIVSRATFGVVGNVVPAVLILIVRLFWGAALLWLLAVAVADTAVGVGWTADRPLVLWSVFAVAALVCIAVAIVGYSLVAAVQAIALVATAILAVAIVVVAWPRSGWGNVGSAAFGPWIGVVEGAVLVFSILGLAWASASGDLARYQRVGSAGTPTALWGGFGASLPMLVLVVFGAAVAVAEPGEAARFGADPVRMLVDTTPHWFAIPVVAAIAVGLMSALIVSLYSGGFAVQAVGFHLPRWASVLALGVVAALVAAGLLMATSGVRTLVLAYPTTLAVPIAAWTGIFLGDFVLRRRRLATDSLLRRGGVYPDWRWVNVIALVLITIIGLGFMHGAAPMLQWEGYLYRLLGIDPDGTLAASDIGVLIAMVLGITVGLISGQRAVPAQESASR
ncbi:purine-cytosine permease family protein [Humibacter ginsenosidimutans]|uniref:Purine-cytosine permease-like protein n=1 Tax=Humibacter ginsenosidimutans TaxID=2599293 RepID=A0A5B8M0P8_9MICO|nr:cytosine permease [Humibacter ginsenosidimutans]QDZ13903.1 hypothetical protein FPZ11_03100 [Humibacter ginsenosidimutans]